VCNHPDLFEERPIVSPFDCTRMTVWSSGKFQGICSRDALKDVDIRAFNFVMSEMEGLSKAHSSILEESAAASKKLIVELGDGSQGNLATAVESGRGAWASVADYKAHIAAKRQSMKNACASQMMVVNSRRCEALPLFGEDLRRLVRVSRPVDEVKIMAADNKKYFNYTSALNDLVLSVEERVFGCGGAKGSDADRSRRPQFDAVSKPIGSLLDILTNFVCMIPKARALPVQAVLSHGDKSFENHLAASVGDVRKTYSAFSDICRPAHIRQQLYFPDKRLLQYDCGKLQVLDGMLRKLKSGGHRVLLFTQMSKVLDIIETFLSFHGHTYIRLDGATKVETRQMLVERFNQDPKMFVFISSTRAGGVGINLTGADTVIFYDSDWNPAMDRQAQDRCHRIGQTREVHIYRLVSESTVEENILKKANQKRHLEDLALKDGATSLFNPDFFKKVDVREFFDSEDVPEPPADVNPLAHLQQQQHVPVRPKPAETTKSKNLITDKEWEMAIANAEDERDVEAMKMAKQEEKEEMHEFDEEDAAVGEGDRDHEGGSASDEASRPDAVSLAIESELTAVQRYALNFLEKEHKQAGITLVEGVVFDKERWEKEQLRRIRDQDADRMYDEDEVLFYEVSGCSSQVYRELCTKLNPGAERGGVEYGNLYEPPNPDDDKHTFINEPMYAGPLSSLVSMGWFLSNAGMDPGAVFVFFVTQPWQAMQQSPVCSPFRVVCSTGSFGCNARA
jgi:E1A-binding protein p400